MFRTTLTHATPRDPSPWVKVQSLMVDLLQTVRRVVGGPKSRKLERVSEAGVRAAFARLRPALEADVAAVLDEVKEVPAVAYLLFDLWAEAAFDEFPIRVEVFGADGEEVEGAARLDGRRLLPGTTLLPPEGAYPLGRFDWIGADTTADLALVERVCIDEFRITWAAADRALPGVRALIGRWAPLLGDEGAFPLFDLGSDAPVLVDALWEERAPTVDVKVP